MSFYVKSRMKMKNEKSFEEHNRTVIYNGTPNYDEIILLKIFDDDIARLSNTHGECDELLVMSKFLDDFTSYSILSVLVSMSDKLRDHLRKIVRNYLHQRARMFEMKFQPV
jgi:hypothetical protein